MIFWLFFCEVTGVLPSTMINDMTSEKEKLNYNELLSTTWLWFRLMNGIKI